MVWLVFHVVRRALFDVEGLSGRRKYPQTAQRTRVDIDPLCFFDDEFQYPVLWRRWSRGEGSYIQASSACGSLDYRDETRKELERKCLAPKRSIPTDIPETILVTSRQVLYDGTKFGGFESDSSRF